MEYIGKRISILKSEDEVSIVISSSENKKVAYFILFWLICWLLCGVVILSEYQKTANENFKIFLIVFSFFWLYFFFRTLYAFLWKSYGLEIIKIKQSKFFIRRAIKKTGKIFSYENDFIKNFRKKELDPGSIVAAISSADWLQNRESLAFDYYGKEIKFGYNLKDADAQELLRLIKYHLRKS